MSEDLIDKIVKLAAEHIRTGYEVRFIKLDDDDCGEAFSYLDRDGFKKQLQELFDESKLL